MYYRCINIYLRLFYNKNLSTHIYNAYLLFFTLLFIYNEHNYNNEHILYINVLKTHPGAIWGILRKYIGWGEYVRILVNTIDIIV